MARVRIYRAEERERKASRCVHSTHIIHQMRSDYGGFMKASRGLACKVWTHGPDHGK